MLGNIWKRMKNSLQNFFQNIGGGQPYKLVLKAEYQNQTYSKEKKPGSSIPRDHQCVVSWRLPSWLAISATAHASMWRGCMVAWPAWHALSGLPHTSGLCWAHSGFSASWLEQDNHCAQLGFSNMDPSWSCSDRVQDDVQFLLDNHQYWVLVAQFFAYEVRTCFGSWAAFRVCLFFSTFQGLLCKGFGVKHFQLPYLGQVEKSILIPFSRKWHLCLLYAFGSFLES